MDVRNGLLLCRHHHRAKRPDNWWPTLHPDGAVTWRHADGRVLVDPPPHAIDDHVRTLLHTDNAHADDAHAAGGQPRRAPPYAA